jgi:hypothetical protein
LSRMDVEIPMSQLPKPTTVRQNIRKVFSQFEQKIDVRKRMLPSVLH